MTIRPLMIAAAFLVLSSPVASAHVEGHENDEEKLIPTTCAQLTETQRYSNDVSYPEIKALKLRCDKAAAEANAKAAAEAKGVAKAKAAAKAKASAEANPTVKPAASSHGHRH
ncbi:MAG: hypothetical protein H0W24_01775 [Lysobacter sp.]|nr:hypothetical protein [Lysobacter sp.]MDQ3269515.1 hypothetical protein [Pseudomonadota bacterium]